MGHKIGLNWCHKLVTQTKMCFYAKAQLHKTFRTLQRTVDRLDLNRLLASATPSFGRTFDTVFYK